MEKRQLELAEKQVRGLTILLSLQFILGVILTTIIDYNPNKQTGVQIAFLVLHIIVAVGLFAGAILRVLTAFRWSYLQTHSLIGLVAIIDALITGGIAASNGNGVAVFMMALGLLAAFAAYGYSASALTSQISETNKRKIDLPKIHP